MTVPLEWFTLPGCIIAAPEENLDASEVLEYISKNGNTTSFMKNDVFSFDGVDKFTIVIVNRLKPIWHFIAMPVADFRKEFFA